MRSTLLRWIMDVTQGVISNKMRVRHLLKNCLNVVWVGERHFFQQLSCILPFAAWQISEDKKQLPTSNLPGNCGVALRGLGLLPAALWAWLWLGWGLVWWRCLPSGRWPFARWASSSRFCESKELLLDSVTGWFCRVSGIRGTSLIGRDTVSSTWEWDWIL